MKINFKKNVLGLLLMWQFSNELNSMTVASAREIREIIERTQAIPNIAIAIGHFNSIATNPDFFFPLIDGGVRPVRQINRATVFYLFGSIFENIGLGAVEDLQDFLQRLHGLTYVQTAYNQQQNWSALWNALTDIQKLRFINWTRLIYKVIIENQNIHTQKYTQATLGVLKEVKELEDLFAYGRRAAEAAMSSISVSGTAVRSAPPSPGDRPTMTRVGSAGSAAAAASGASTVSTVGTSHESKSSQTSPDRVE